MDWRHVFLRECARDCGAVIELLENMLHEQDRARFYKHATVGMVLLNLLLIGKVFRWY